MPRVLQAEFPVELPMPKGGEDAARGFYGRILGLREVMKPPGERGVWFDVAGTPIRLRIADPAAPAGGASVKAKFRVDSAEGLRKAVDKARFRHYDAPPVAGTRGFYGLDPFGNKIEFREQVGAARPG